MATNSRALKKSLLRNNEYYEMQEVFDELYQKSLLGHKFSKLLDIITSDNNIQLAYRNIKSNSGSTTRGTDRMTIKDIDRMHSEEYIRHIQKKFDNYQPKSVRRVQIPKPGSNKKRQLGIPCIEDRLIQQCIKQVLEPICEAKFHNHSYGFRPDRSTHDAIGRMYYLIDRGYHYVVDIDIKGFFDNVNHAKLKKQLWTMGIQDKKVISIIGKMLKAEIEGEGIPEKGTPQGSIISPLLSNIVLNELDWWISDQWETFQSRHEYYDNNSKYRALRKGSNLKQCFIIRYADDFKIMCKDHESAQKIFIATKMWLKERLKLDISPEKSKITNLRKRYSEFLGYKIKARINRKLKNGNLSWVPHSRMTDKSFDRVYKSFKQQIIKIQVNANAKNVSRLNSMILGIHNYNKYATAINRDLVKLHFLVDRILYNRLRSRTTNRLNKSSVYEQFYGDYKSGKMRTIANVTIFPIYGCKFKIRKQYNQNTCNYTEKGRKLVHKKLQGHHEMLIEYLLRNHAEGQSTKLLDNKISLMAQQKGKCAITKRYLMPYDMECHHKVPKFKGGTDEYRNLAWTCKDVHKLIHATKEETINKYLTNLNLNNAEIKRLNSMRLLVGNQKIELKK